MIFSPTDIPIPAASPIGEFVERIQKIDPGRNGLSPAQIADLLPKIDDSVARTHAVLDFIIEYDLKWRTSVFRGETEYDEGIEQRIEMGLSVLVAAAENLVSQLDRFRSYGLNAESIETLRPLIANVRKMLATDDEFFEGEELDNLAAEAVAADEAGQAVEFRVMGE